MYVCIVGMRSMLAGHKGNHVDLHPFRITAVKQVNDLTVVFLCFAASGVGCVPSYYM